LHTWVIARSNKKSKILFGQLLNLVNKTAVTADLWRIYHYDSQNYSPGQRNYILHKISDHNPPETR